MTFLYPPAFIALFLVAAPIFIHLFVHRRAERLVFPTIRFIQPSRLASMRRRMLDDVPLLAVRIAILLAAIAALAAPLVITSARQREWSARVVTQTVAGADLRDGIRRAVAALDHAPLARRELVVSSAFPIGSLTAADITAVPSSIGLRFERTGALPESRMVADARVLADAGTLLSREVTLAGPRTSVRETRLLVRASLPIEIDASPESKPAIDAAIAAVLSQRVWAPPADRRARLIVADRSADRFRQGDGGPPKPYAEAESFALRATPIATPWMAEAIARMSRDSDLQLAASGATTGVSDTRFTSAPWHPVAAAADGTPLVAAAGSASGLLVASAAGAFDLVTPLLLRSIVNSLAVVPDLRQAEVVAISDAQLRAWSRSAPAPTAPRLENVDRDDRRWLWAGVLVLLALETWMRRGRATRGDAVAEDVARVA